MIGRIVGTYKIIQALGEGGVGMVYKGVDTMLDREVAIKVLRPELASQTSVVERFRSEAVTLAKLSHPNIATLYSLFRDGNDLIMILEFINGQTLDQMLYRQGRITTDEAIPIFCQALEGINYAHKLGIVHRDIKPGNMMLTEDGILKVLDFGIARLLGSNRMTRVGNVIGTLEYMSPEQVRGLETDARSDVYGLGIMLYEMLTGRLPFESENDFALMKMQTENMPTPPRQINPEIPVEVENAIMKSVSKDPNQRFQSAGDYLDCFLEMGFALPNKTYYARKNSRPSNPGIQSGETSVLPNSVSIQTIQNQTLSLPISKPEIPIKFDEKVEQINPKIKETQIGQQQPEIKGTRLVPPTTPVQNEQKATRLGSAQTNSLQTADNPTFFSKLNWMHYTGAGAVVLFVLTLVGTAAVLPFVWGNAAKENSTKIEQKPNPVPTSQPNNADNQSPIGKDDQSKETINDSGGGIPMTSSNSSVANNPNTAITPIPNDSRTVPQPVQNQPKEPQTVKNNPPTVTRSQPPRQSSAPPVSTRNNRGSASNSGSGTTGSRQEAANVMTDRRKPDN